MDYKALWAKKKRIDDKFMYLPLYIHLEETGQIAELLWVHWLSPGMREYIRETTYPDYDYDLGEEKCKSLIVFLGMIHDIGKSLPNFAYKENFYNDAELDLRIHEHLEKAGFTFKEAKKNKPIKHNEASQNILEKYGVNRTISLIAGAHHGRPIEGNVYGSMADRASDYFQIEDKSSDLYKAWEGIHKKLLDLALEKSGFESVDDLPILKENVQVILTGLLIMADWIASNEKYFPLIDLEGKNLGQDRVKQGFTKWLEDKTRPWTPKNTNIETMFEESFAFEPRLDQEIVCRTCQKLEEPGILIYEAATGSGKTEASLVASEILANKTARTGLFFALPSQATSNSMFLRINKWLSKHSEKTVESFPTRLIHGKAYLNEDFTRLRPASEIYENEDGEEAGLSVNSYFTGRKLAILDDFTVGTIDQVLLMALKQKHLMLKHLGLSNKVVIIDEVHSYDTYMSVYLDEALKWLGSYKVPVIILSATLPMDRRNDLLEAYLIGRYGKIRNMPRPENYENNRAYPLLTYNDGREILQHEDFSEAKKKSIAIKKIGLDEFDSIYSIIEKQRPDGGAIGIFVNTVRKAQEVAKALMERLPKDEVDLIHSAYIASHRLKKENELIQLLGPGKNGKPNPNRPKFKVIVGTQVMEQSLDIDFDLIFTELAPIDLLIQRMGRLHRHKENIRPKNLENPQAYVLNAKDFNFDKGSGYVYEKKILMRTEYFLPDEIVVPDSVSDLVQDVYGKKEMEISEENRTIYEEYERSYESLVKRKEVKAGAFRIANPQQKIGEEKNISRWIANSNPSAEKFEENALAQVRDSLETLEVILLKEVKGGLSLIGSEDPITSLDKGVDKKIAQETIRLPAALCHGKCRDKERYKLDVLIEDLEDYYNENLSFWDDSTWLKGNLAMVLDEKGCYEFDGFLITYDEDRGLIYTRKE